MSALSWIEWHMSDSFTSSAHLGDAPLVNPNPKPQKLRLEGRAAPALTSAIEHCEVLELREPGGRGRAKPFLQHVSNKALIKRLIPTVFWQDEGATSQNSCKLESITGFTLQPTAGGCPAHGARPWGLAAARGRGPLAPSGLVRSFHKNI